MLEEKLNILVLGMVTYKMSKVTIFYHKHFFLQKFKISMLAFDMLINADKMPIKADKS